MQTPVRGGNLVAHEEVFGQAVMDFWGQNTEVRNEEILGISQVQEHVTKQFARRKLLWLGMVY